MKQEAFDVSAGEASETFGAADYEAVATAHHNKEAAYHRLRTAIGSGELTPGSPLRERSLGEQFGVSRTVVRELLRRLQFEGLVYIVPHSGAFVRGLTPQQIQDVFYARQGVEGMAARLAAERHLSSQLESVEADLKSVVEKEPTLVALSEAGAKLHGFIISASANNSLQRAFSVLKSEAMLVRSLTQSPALLSSSPPAIIEIEMVSYEEHISILDAVKKRKADLAEELMRSHLQSTQSRLIRQLSMEHRV